MRKIKAFLLAIILIIISTNTSLVHANSNEEAEVLRIAKERLNAVYGENLSDEVYQLALEESMRLITSDSVILTYTEDTEDAEDAAMAYCLSCRKSIYQFLSKQKDVTWTPGDDTGKDNAMYLKEHFKEALLYGISEMSLYEYLAGVEAKDLISTNNAGLLYAPVDPNPSLTQRINAIDYALLYAMSYNTAYPYWGSNRDCANFVSQCVFAGGKQMIGSPSTSNYLDTTKWYSQGTIASTAYVSVSWCGAAEFFTHWHSRAVSYQIFTATQMADGGAAYTYAQPGDVISLLLSDGTPYHTMIVVSKTTSGELYLAAHSSATTNTKLSSKASSALGGCVVYNIYGN